MGHLFNWIRVNSQFGHPRRRPMTPDHSGQKKWKSSNLRAARREVQKKRRASAGMFFSLYGSSQSIVIAIITTYLLTSLVDSNNWTILITIISTCCQSTINWLATSKQASLNLSFSSNFLLLSVSVCGSFSSAQCTSRYPRRLFVVLVLKLSHSAHQSVTNYRPSEELRQEETSSSFAHQNIYCHSLTVLRLIVLSWMYSWSCMVASLLPSFCRAAPSPND